MSELFTTFESVTPPKIVPLDTLQNYLEIQNMSLPAILPELTLQQKDLFKGIDSYLTPPVYTKKPSFKSSDNSAIQSIISNARSFVGGKYTWGGASPSTGFDCSGLMQYVFKQAGINLPRTAMLQGKVGLQVDIQSAKPGDIIWFGSKSSPSGQHIGLISKIDNGLIYIIDASGKKNGIVERLLPNLPIKSVRRLIGGGFNNFSSNSNFSKFALNFFKSKGLSDVHARGIVGNLLQESNGNHTAINKSSGAYGLALWLGARKLKLFLRYGSNPTPTLQLEFIWEELNTSERNAFLKLLNTNTITNATRSFANNFERAGKNEMNMSRRISNAYRA